MKINVVAGKYVRKIVNAAEDGLLLNELYWAAGFLEGEGTFGHYKRQDVVLSDQVQIEPLLRLKRILGGRVYGPYGPYKNPKHSPYFKWEAIGPRARGIMMTLYRLLSPKRREEIRCALRVG